MLWYDIKGLIVRIHSYAFDPIWYSDSYRSLCAPVSLHFFAPVYPFFRDIPDIPLNMLDSAKLHYHIWSSLICQRHPKPPCSSRNTCRLTIPICQCLFAGEAMLSGHVDGVRCDRALLEAAERVASNGPIGLVDAMDLWDKAKDGVRLRSFFFFLLSCL